MSPFYSSQSVSEDQVCSGMEWSLGESIMKTMSQNGLTVFDLDNPTSARWVEDRWVEDRWVDATPDG